MSAAATLLIGFLLAGDESLVSYLSAGILGLMAAAGLVAWRRALPLSLLILAIIGTVHVASDRVPWQFAALLLAGGGLVYRLIRRKTSGTDSDVGFRLRPAMVGAATLVGLLAGALAVTVPIMVRRQPSGVVAIAGDPLGRLGDLPLWAGVLGAALVNALAEEWIWRGLVIDLLRNTGWSAPVAVVLQATSFGIAHLEGIPGGVLGVGLASIFGIMAGLIVAPHKGRIAYAVMAHWSADLVIVGTLALNPQLFLRLA